jgi:CrcB protein
VRPFLVVTVVAAGGVLGSLGRLAVELAIPWSGVLPWATLIVNIVGALAIGVLATTIVEVRPWVRPFAITGVLGGFTTFSAFALQTGVLLDAGSTAAAAAYVAITLVGGLVAVAVGAELGPRMRRVIP